jgi:hypothetical protein
MKIMNGDTLVDATQEDIDDITAVRENMFHDKIVSHLPDYRYKKEIGGISLNGINIQTDRESRSILTGAYIRAKEDNTYTVRWKTADGFVTLNAGQIIAISDAVAEHVQKCYAAEADVAADILSFTSVAEVETAFDQSYLIQ